MVFVESDLLFCICTDALTIYSLYTVKKMLQEMKQIFSGCFFVLNCSQNSVKLSLNELLGCYFQYYDISVLLGLKGFLLSGFCGLSLASVLQSRRRPRNIDVMLHVALFKSRNCFTFCKRVRKNGFKFMFTLI